jgi:hypothetical protein
MFGFGSSAGPSARQSAGPAGSFLSTTPYVSGSLKTAIDTYTAEVERREGRYNETLKTEIRLINTSVDTLIAKVGSLRNQLTAKETEIAQLKRQPDNAIELQRANAELETLKTELAAGITQLNVLTQSLRDAQPMPQELTALKDKIARAIGLGSGDGGGGTSYNAAGVNGGLGSGGVGGVLIGGSKKSKKSKKRRKYKKYKKKSKRK